MGRGYVSCRELCCRDSIRAISSAGDLRAGLAHHSHGLPPHGARLRVGQRHEGAVRRMRWLRPPCSTCTRCPRLVCC